MGGKAKQIRSEYYSTLNCRLLHPIVVGRIRCRTSRLIEITSAHGLPSLIEASNFCAMCKQKANKSTKCERRKMENRFVIEREISFVSSCDVFSFLKTQQSNMLGWWFVFRHHAVSLSDTIYTLWPGRRKRNADRSFAFSSLFTKSNEIVFVLLSLFV